jgi:hypothetical protein
LPLFNSRPYFIKPIPEFTGVFIIEHLYFITQPFTQRPVLDVGPDFGNKGPYLFHPVRKAPFGKSVAAEYYSVKTPGVFHEIPAFFENLFKSVVDKLDALSFSSTRARHFQQ